MESILMRNICFEMLNHFGVQGESAVAFFHTIGFTYGYSRSTTSWLSGTPAPRVIHQKLHSADEDLNN